jgi:hypothetical protein
MIPEQKWLIRTAGPDDGQDPSVFDGWAPFPPVDNDTVYLRKAVVELMEDYEAVVDEYRDGWNISPTGPNAGDVEPYNFRVPMTIDDDPTLKSPGEPVSIAGPSIELTIHFRDTLDTAEFKYGEVFLAEWKEYAFVVQTHYESHYFPIDRIKQVVQRD